MALYTSPEQQVNYKIQRHRAVIGYLVSVVIILAILLMLFFGLVIYRQSLVSGSSKPSPFVGMASLFSVIGLVIVPLAFCVVLCWIGSYWASNVVTRPLQGHSAVIIERTSQQQNAELSGTPIG